MQFRIFAKKIIRSELDFSRLQKSYRIDSLALHKLNLSKILEYYRQIEVKYTFESKKGKTWFENELRIFIWVVFNYANFLSKKPSELNEQEWQIVSQYFHKDHLTCKYFFLCIEKNRKSHWTEEEDQVIMEHINKPAFTNEWTEIGKELFLSSNGVKFKKPKEIRQRWNNYLNPNVLKDKWSIDEDLVLFRIVGKEGRKWALISKILKTRSEHSVKNRYTNLFKKFKSFQSNSLRFRRSELEAEFIKVSLKRLEEQKSKSTAENQQPMPNISINEPKLHQRQGQRVSSSAHQQNPMVLEPSNQNLGQKDYWSPALDDHFGSHENPENGFIYEQNPEQDDICAQFGLNGKQKGQMEADKCSEHQHSSQLQKSPIKSSKHSNRSRHTCESKLRELTPERLAPGMGDSKSRSKGKQLCGQSSFEVSPELQFIKSPIHYGEKEDDFMSTENLMRSFQPSYHHYLF